VYPWACRVAWSILLALGARDSDSNSDRPIFVSFCGVNLPPDKFKYWFYYIKKGEVFFYVFYVCKMYRLWKIISKNGEFTGNGDIGG
jgi:hypothetical protein